MPFEHMKQGDNQPMISLTMDQIMEIVKALKEPSPEQARKDKEEAELKARQLASMQELGRAEEQAKIDREANCTHKKEKGEWALGGQEHTDGKIHPVCLRCGKEFPPYQAQHGAQGI